MTHRFGDGATADLRDALEFYASRSPEHSERFLARLTEGVMEISEHPARYPREEHVGRNREVRRYVLTNFPYSLIYEVEPRGILIVAVAHHSRRSGYWRRRKD